MLGLKLSEDNLWSRAKAIPILQQGSSYKDLHSWIASLACSHYPILKWLRPAARILERLAVILNKKAKPSDPLPEEVLTKSRQLTEDIQSKGDPATGTFSVKTSGEWKLYTDASSIAMGACLYISDKYVEDVGWLRKLTDCRPIDTVELEAVLRGMNALLIPWMRATGLLKGVKVTVFVDNMPTLGQLRRKQGEHWTSAKGLTSAASEARLQMIEDLVSLYEIQVTYEYVESGNNPADELTRVPIYLQPSKEMKMNPHNSINMAIHTTKSTQDADLPSTSWRSLATVQEGKLHVPLEVLKEFLTEVHDHEGGQALFNRVSKWVITSGPGLHSKCMEVSKECLICRVSKGDPNQNQKGLTENLHKRSLERSEVSDACPSSVPFNKVHLDVLGNFQTSPVDSRKMFFVTAVVDNATGYAFCKASKFSPTGNDVVSLLAHVTEVVHKNPLMICTDGGSNFMSDAVREFILSREILHKVSPKHSSSSNGKVERFFRVVNEYLRSHCTSENPSWSEFQALVARGVCKINCTPYSKVSAHEKVFTFQPVIERAEHRPLETREEFNKLCQRSEWNVGLEKGSPILVRDFHPANKLAKRWIPAKVEARVGRTAYTLQGHPGKFDLKDLKLLSSSSF